MQSEELNTISIYSGDPANESPEQQIAKERQQRAIQAKLPKFELEPNESFCIPREKIVELNIIYFGMLDDMEGGFKLANQNMRSYMESVVFESYKSELEKLQSEHAIEQQHKDSVYLYKKRMLKADDEKRWRFSREKPNYIKRLLLREAKIEAEMKLAEYRAEILKQEEFLYGEPEEPEGLNDLFELIVDEISPKRKKHFINKHGEQLKSLILKLMQKPLPEPEEKDRVPEKQEQVKTFETPVAPEQAVVADIVESDENELDELYELEEQIKDVVPEIKELVSFSENDSAIVMVPMTVEGADIEEPQQEATAKTGEDIKEQERKNDS